ESIGGLLGRFGRGRLRMVSGRWRGGRQRRRQHGPLQVRRRDLEALSASRAVALLAGLVAEAVVDDAAARAGEVNQHALLRRRVSGPLVLGREGACCPESSERPSRWQRLSGGRRWSAREKEPASPFLLAHPGTRADPALLSGRPSA